MRKRSLVLVALAGLCVRSAVPTQLSPLRDQPVIVSAVPVDLYPGDPARRDLGAFTYLGGWALGGDAGWFGGLSSLAADGHHLTAVTDAGGLVEFDVGRFGHVSNAHVMPIPAGCGSGGDKADRDSEALTQDPLSGDWWIALEGRNAVCRLGSDLQSFVRRARPRAMRDWPFNFGAETLQRLADGRVMALSEGDPEGRDTRPLLLFDRDPTDPRAVPARLTYRPPAGFNPTDAAQLPDGRLLVVNRRFRPWSLFTVVLTIVDPARFAPGAIVEGPVVARFEPPVVTENFEGIAVTQDEFGQLLVWLVSDNNFASWQRTLLLKFALDPARLPPR